VSAASARPARSTARYAVSSSGGKDSTLALYRARRQGLAVTHMLSLYGTEHARVRFHGYRPDVLAAQAEALGLQALIEPSGADTFEDDFARALARARAIGLTGVLFGNLWLEDVRDWYRSRVEAAGLEYRDMLWGVEPAEVVREFVDAGFRAVVTCVWLKRLGPDCLGRRLDHAFLAELGEMEGVDPAGEQGEYHTLAYDGPGFAQPVRFTTHGVRQDGDFALLDLRLA
jgi:diphthine-ammonia ligase